jgi:hypothetical protein
MIKDFNIDGIVYTFKTDADVDIDFLLDKKEDNVSYFKLKLDFSCTSSTCFKFIIHLYYLINFI